MTQNVEDLFQSAVDRYNSGESSATLIPVFEDICKKSAKLGPAWTCLAWLYLLESKPEKALKAAQTGMKLDPTDAQTRVNLTLAMLEAGKKGIRPHIEAIQQILVHDNEQIDLLKSNFEDGVKRRPEWPQLQKVKSWIFD